MDYYSITVFVLIIFIVFVLLPKYLFILRKNNELYIKNHFRYYVTLAPFLIFFTTGLCIFLLPNVLIEIFKGPWYIFESLYVFEILRGRFRPGLLVACLAFIGLVVEFSLCFLPSSAAWFLLNRAFGVRVIKRKYVNLFIIYFVFYLLFAYFNSLGTLVNYGSG